MKQIIDEIAAREHIKTEQQILRINADAFKLYSTMNAMIDMAGDSVSPKERKKLLAALDEMKSHIAGNID